MVELDLETARQKLQQTLKGETQVKAAVWQRFDDIVSRMSNDQQAFVNSNEKAVAKRQEMMEVFINWMFEVHKNEFAQHFGKLANDYVDTVAETAQEFGKRAAGLAKENEELRRQLAELQAQKNGGTL